MIQAEVNLAISDFIASADRVQAAYLSRLSYIQYEREKGELILGLPNRMMYTRFVQLSKESLETHLMERLQITRLSVMVDENGTPLFGEIDDDLAQSIPTAPSVASFALSAPLPPSFSVDEYRLNPKLTLQQFLPGEINRVPLAAATQMARNPGDMQSALLLFYGKVGVGKTHLLHGIGNETLLMSPSKRVVFMSSEQFLNDYVRHIQQNNMENFRKHYRSCDLLMIDDVQFFEGKEKTQEELFNIYNHLHANGGKMVFTSDRPPSILRDMSDRLLSRLAGGLIIEVRSPDFHLRRDILRLRLSEKQITLKPELMDFLAEALSASVRVIESAAIKLGFYAMYEDTTEWSIDRVKSLIQDVVDLSTPASTALSPDRVVAFVARHYAVSGAELRGASKSQRVVVARRTAMALCRDLTDWSLAEIGKYFGNKNHTTVIKAIKAIHDLCQSDPRSQSLYESIKRELQERN